MLSYDCTSIKRIAEEFIYSPKIYASWKNNFEIHKFSLDHLWFIGTGLFRPCLFCPSDNFETCLALPMRWPASVCAFSYWYLFCDPRRWDNSRKVAHRGASARRERHTLSLGRNKHGHNNSAPIYMYVRAVGRSTLDQ